jgi:hypothetical protein
MLHNSNSQQEEKSEYEKSEYEKSEYEKSEYEKSEYEKSPTSIIGSSSFDKRLNKRLVPVSTSLVDQHVHNQKSLVQVQNSTEL